MTRFIGIDPGLHGAVAAIDDAGIRLYDLDGTYKTVMNIAYPESYGDWVYTAVEDVCGRPGQSCSANTTFMKQAGMAELAGYMMATRGDESFSKVRPQVWKKHFGLITKGLTTTQRKHLSVDLARKLYPEIADQLLLSKDGRAEALLIARYCKDAYEELQSNSGETTEDSKE